MRTWHLKIPQEKRLSMAYDEVGRCKQGPHNINLSIIKALDAIHPQYNGRHQKTGCPQRKRSKSLHGPQWPAVEPLDVGLSPLFWSKATEDSWEKLVSYLRASLGKTRLKRKFSFFLTPADASFKHLSLLQLDKDLTICFQFLENRKKWENIFSSARVQYSSKF